MLYIKTSRHLSVGMNIYSIGYTDYFTQLAFIALITAELKPP